MPLKCVVLNKEVVVISLAFAIALGERDGAAFVNEVDTEAIKIIGKYVEKLELSKSMDIWGCNIRLNRVF